MKPLSAKRIIVILKRNGFIFSRQKGSHSIWKNPITGSTVPVPLHGGTRPIPTGTFMAIVDESKISKGEFR